VRTTAGSRILDRFVPTYDATVAAKLEQAGAWGQVLCAVHSAILSAHSYTALCAAHDLQSCLPSMHLPQRPLPSPVSRGYSGGKDEHG